MNFTFLFLFLFFIPQTVGAIMYSPGETLEPSCYPADVDCGVISPVYINEALTNGGLLFASSSVWSILSAGEDGKILKISGGIPNWSNDNGGISYNAGNGILLSSSTFSIDLNNANTWVGFQTFSSGIIAPSSTNTINGLVVSSSTITAGIWNGTDISDDYIVSATNWNEKIGSATINGGLVKTGTGLGLLNTCTNGQILKYDGSSWICDDVGSGIATINGLSGSIQNFAASTTGTDFSITSDGNTHTFSIPDASATARGLVTTIAQTFAGLKTFSSGIKTDVISPLLDGNESIKITKADGVTAILNIDTINSRIGIGTTTPSEKLSIVGNIGISGSIIPSANDTYALGSPDMVWRDLYVGPGSIYIDGQKVLQTDDSDSVVVTSDPMQNLILKTSEGGNIELNAATSSILFKSDIMVTTGKTFRTTDLSAVNFSDGIKAGNLKLTQNALEAVNLNGSIEIKPDGLGITYFSSGNVGIGTSTPAYKLDVAGDIKNSANILSNNGTGSIFKWDSTNNILLMGGETEKTLSGIATGAIQIQSNVANDSDIVMVTGNSVFPALKFAASKGTVQAPTSLTGGANRLGEIHFKGYYGAYRDSARIAGIQDGTWANNNYPSALTFNTLKAGTSGTATEKMRISSSGNVGIGTITPTALLSLNSGNSTNSTALNIVGDLNSYLQTNIQNLNTGSSASSDYVATANNGTASSYYVDMGINGSGGGGQPFTTPNDAYLYSSDTNLNIGALGATSTLKFFTTGGMSSPLERMRIDSSGNVGIGTDNPGSYKLSIAGTGYLGTAAWAYSSDRRLKDNILYIDNDNSSLDKILQLKPTKFDYISGEKNQIGFIAQDVRAIIPEAVMVTNQETGMLGLKTDFIIPYIVGSIQEQQNQIELLKSGLGVSDSALDESVSIGGLTVSGIVDLGKDNIGEAVIKAGASEVSIVFEKTYTNKPVINISKMTHGSLSDYYVDEVNKNGFKIKIEPIQNKDIVFSWHAFGSNDGVRIFSDGVRENIENYLHVPVPSLNPDPIIEPEDTVNESEEVATDPGPILETEQILEPEPILEQGPEPTQDPVVESLDQIEPLTQTES